MTAKEFLQEKGIHPTEPIYWDLEDTTISLDELMQEYTDKQLLIQRVSNQRELLLNFLDWYNEDEEKTPVTEDEIDLFIKEKIK